MKNLGPRPQPKSRHTCRHHVLVDVGSALRLWRNPRRVIFSFALQRIAFTTLSTKPELLDNGPQVTRRTRSLDLANNRPEIEYTVLNNRTSVICRSLRTPAPNIQGTQAGGYDPPSAASLPRCWADAWPAGRTVYSRYPKASSSEGLRHVTDVTSNKTLACGESHARTASKDFLSPQCPHHYLPSMSKPSSQSDACTNKFKTSNNTG